MAKVNFTKEHYAKMQSLAFAMLVANETINTKMGQPLNIVDFFHCLEYKFLFHINSIFISINITVLSSKGHGGCSIHRLRSPSHLRERLFSKRRDEMGA